MVRSGGSGGHDGVGGGAALDKGPVGVLMLTKGLGRGGTERLLSGMVGHVDRSRFRVEIAYLLPCKDAFVDEIQARGVAVHCLEARRSISLGWLGRLRRLVRDHDIRLIHTHMPLSASAARLAFLGSASPLMVHTEHNLWERYRAPTRWANARTYGRNAAVIAVSDGVAQSIRSRRSVRTVIHGIDLATLQHGAESRRYARATLGIPDHVPVVGTVGNFTPKKDHVTLLRAFAQIRARDRGARLVLVGTGPLERTLRRQAREFNVQEATLFTGMRADVLDLLPGFDLFVLSSRFEGLPIALLEAMGSGVACIASRVGGVPEVITDGENGLLAEPGDAEGLAAALETLLVDDDTRAKLADRARGRAGDFDLAKAVRRIEHIYDIVLGGTVTRDTSTASQASGIVKSSR